MHARVATFELGADADTMIEGVKRDVEGGTPPPGLEDVRGLTMLVDRANGQAMAILLFDDEAGMRRSDAALNGMSPQGSGRRTGVGFYEVAVHRTL